MSEGVIGGIHDDATYAAIDAAWDSWGRRDTDVIAHLFNPAFLGGPRWPALRQAHSIARRDNALLVASSGLADPTEWADAAPTNGYELEVYGITPDLPLDSDAMTIAHSWFGQTVMTVSNLVAQYGFEVPDLVDRDGVITIELAEAELPAEAAGTYLEDGAAVVMVGITDRELPATVDGPLSTIRLLNVKLLTAAEGRFCVNNPRGDENARHELTRRFAQQGHPLWSSLTRPSVV
ncbi:hypothetical protein JK358_02830 [Nocardia sp. 2]|uniref:Suppressor of fused protein SUFU n=1 Tax=Nocardia acididurans TaxID=2802282 RepID=A0ABS1LZH6_9NOCA|nr:hypothetical protein [Nocardia acididurans]MBL1073324.1 hypothetical protein [Nocardia acididurans]